MQIPIYAGGTWAALGEVVAYAEVDPEDFAVQGKHRWHLNPSGYAVRSSQPPTPPVCPECGWVPRAGAHVAHSVASHRGIMHRVPRERRHTIIMHREILGLRRGDLRTGDHKNRNRLDNRRSNLRIISAAAQAQNQGSWTHWRGKPTESAHRGVYKVKKRGVWTGRWKALVNDHYLGCFTSEEAAAEAAQQYRLQTMPHALD